MSDLTLYRKANISSKAAKREVLAHPDAKGYALTELAVEPATAENARHAHVAPGDMIFVARLHTADFGEEEGGGDPEPAFAQADGPSEDPPEDKAEDKPEDKSSEESSPPKEKKPEGESGESESNESKEPKKMSGDEEIVHLLKQILDAVSGDALGMGAPDDLDADAGLPMPKGHGPGMPPPGGPPPGPGGPPGAGHGHPPLPPPVDKEPGGMAFARYDKTASALTVVRSDANELGLRGLRAEAETVFPTHRVAKIRTTGFATIDGDSYYLPEARIAILELTRR